MAGLKLAGIFVIALAVAALATAGSASAATSDYTRQSVCDALCGSSPLCVGKQIGSPCGTDGACDASCQCAGISCDSVAELDTSRQCCGAYGYTWAKPGESTPFGGFSELDIETRNPECVGDDAGEYYKSRQCEGRGCASDPNDYAACASTSSCVYSGACFQRGGRVQGSMLCIQPTIPIPPPPAPRPSCYDGKQNQDELGVDCGGACTTAAREACDGRDNNRNCYIDEGLAGCRYTNQCVELVRGYGNVYHCGNYRGSICSNKLAEVCNGKDDNNNCEVDEGAVCTKDKPATCFNGIKDGSETGVDCGGSCILRWNLSYTVIIMPETCNGKDDNRNCKVDESCLNSFEMERAVQGSWGVQGVPSVSCYAGDGSCGGYCKTGAVEICDGVDNNGDCQVDENCMTAEQAAAAQGITVPS